MSEGPLEELVRYTLQLAAGIPPECQGNGYYHREYKIGEISLVIDGWWDPQTNGEKDTGYFVEFGLTDVLDGEMGEPPVQRTSDDNLVLNVLEDVRRHLILERLADV